MTEPSLTLLASDPAAAVLCNLRACMADAAGDTENASTLFELANQMAAHCIGLGQDPAGIRTAAEALALLAELSGAVVTVTQRPLLPLAMGHYCHEVAVRPAGERVR